MQIHKYMPISDLNKRKNKNNEKWQYPFVRDNKIQQIFNHIKIVTICIFCLLHSHNLPVPKFHKSFMRNIYNLFLLIMAILFSEIETTTQNG